MKLHPVGVVVPLLLGVQVAAADRPVPLRVDAVATSAVARFPARGGIYMIGQGWCTDRGAGQSLTLTFAPASVVGQIDLSVGTTTMARYADPTAIEIDVEGTKYTPAIEDGAVRLRLDKPVLASMIDVKITAVGKSKSKLSCLSNLAMRDGEGNLYPTLVGVDEAALAALPDFAAQADAALRACDATGLAAVAGFPLVQVHTTYKWAESGSYPVDKVTKFKDVKALVKACKKQGSFLALGWGGGDDRAESLDVALGGQIESPRPGAVTIGNEANFVATWAGDHWTLTGVGTVKPADE